MKYTIVFSLLILSCIVILGGPMQLPQRGPVGPDVPSPAPELRPNTNQPAIPLPNFPSTRERQVEFHADKQITIGEIVQYRGHVEMTTESVTVTADELDYNPSSKLADVRGNVKVQVRPAGPLIVPLKR